MQKLNPSISKKKILLFFCFTIISYICLLFVFNEKTLLLVALMYAAELFFILHFSFKDTILFCLIFFLPFEHGLRAWIVDVVKPNPLEHLGGYSFYFGFTLKLIFSTLILLASLFDLKRISKNPTIPLLLGWFLLVLITQIFTTPSIYSYMGIIRLLIPLACFIGSSWLTHEQPRLIPYIIIIISSCLLLQTVLGTYQTLTNHPLGVMLEDTGGQTLYQTSDGVKLSRVSGLLGHPTFFGTFITLFIPFIFYSFTFFSPKQRLSMKKIVLYFCIIIPIIVALIGTYSRSAWLIALILTIWYFGKKQTRALAAGIGVIIVVLLLFFPITSRIASIENFFSSGSGKGRLDLINRSLTVINDNPIQGIGMNQFTLYVTNNFNLSDNEKGFLYPVHNTWLILATETGLPATILLVLIIGKIIFCTKPTTHLKTYFIPFWFGAIAFLLSSQIHPLLNQDPSFDYFFLFLGILSTAI